MHARIVRIFYQIAIWISTDHCRRIGNEALIQVILRCGISHRDGSTFGWCQSAHIFIGTCKRICYSHIIQSDISNIRHAKRISDHFSGFIKCQRRSSFGQLYGRLTNHKYSCIVSIFYRLIVWSDSRSCGCIDQVFIVYIGLSQGVGSCESFTFTRCQSPHRLIEGCQWISHFHIRQGHISDIGHHNSIGDHLTGRIVELRIRSFDHFDCTVLNSYDLFIIGIFHHFIVWSGTCSCSNIGHRSCIHFCLTHSVSSLELLGFIWQQYRNGLRQSSQRICYFHIGQCHIPNIGYFQCISDHLISSRVDFWRGRFSNFYSTDLIGFGDDLILIADFYIIWINTYYCSGIEDFSTVHICLSDCVGSLSRLCLIWSKRSCIVSQSSQRVRNRHICQRHIPGIRHRKRIENHISSLIVGGLCGFFD